MDLSFIGKPHHTDPRRVYSTTGTDYQERINFERLHRDRLARAKQMMEKFDLGAMLFFQGANIRYITGSYQGNWKYNIFIRYAVLPRGGEPVLFETAGSDLQCAKIDLPWLEGRIRPAMTWRWAEGATDHMVNKMADSVIEVLKEAGVEKERIGMDDFDMAAYQAFINKGLNIVSAWPAISAARVVKTPDEIELHKQAATIGDGAMWRIKHEWLKPGVRERDIEAKVHEYMLSQGCEIIYDIIVASGGNTSPYRRWATDKIIRNGDLVIIDINAVGPGGYFVDFVRCYKAGDMKPTQKERDLYKEVYDSMYAGISQLVPGKTTGDVARQFPEYDDDTYGTVTLQQFAHSIGITLYEGMWTSRAYSMDYPAVIEPNMYFAIETFAGHPFLQQTVRLEENVLVTEDGPVVFTLAPFADGMLDHLGY